MKQINDLLVYEIKKASKYITRNLELAVIDESSRKLGVEVFQLPAPCSIIGLASEFGLIRKMQITKDAGYKVWAEFLYSEGLTSPTSDYLFLKIER